MLRSWHIALLFLICEIAPAQAQTAAILSTSRSAPPGVTVIPPGYNDAAQWIIPRFANGKTPPAGAIVGWGPLSIIRATAATEKLPAATRGIVITEDYDQEIRQFQGQLPNDKVRPPVLQPVIRDLTIAGRDVTGDDYVKNGAVNDAGNPGVDKYDGLLWKASGGLVENVNFFGIPGTAAVFARGCCPKDKAGEIRPFDNSKLKVWNVNVARCNRGININVVDAIIGNITGAYSKEYILKLSAGATQIAGAVHTWGAEKGVWIVGSRNWGGPFYVEQGPVALQIDGSSNDLGPIYAHSATVACIVVTGTNNTLRQVRIPMAGIEPVGVAINNQYNSIADGRITVADGKKGIAVGWAGGVGLRLRDVHVAGGKGATLIDCSGAPPQFGLTESVIDVHLNGQGAIGLDLVRDNGTSVLGPNNTITVTTPAKHGLATIVDLPAGWQSTTPRKTSNVVTINGVRFYPPRDE